MYYNPIQGNGQNYQQPNTSNPVANPVIGKTGQANANILNVSPDGGPGPQAQDFPKGCGANTTGTAPASGVVPAYLGGGTPGEFW